MFKPTTEQMIAVMDILIRYAAAGLAAVGDGDENHAELVRALRCRVMGDKCAEGCICYKNFDFQCDSDYRMFDAAADRLEALEAELAALREKQRWIPVTERLPEDDVAVLVSCISPFRTKDGAQRRVQRVDFLKYGLDGGWQMTNRNYEITHWMPLPEPPKEEREC